MWKSRSLDGHMKVEGNPLVQIQLFGGIRAATTDGEPVDVGPSKCQALLAALALSPGSAVPVSRLIDLVWGSDPPRTADKTLQSYITRLRKGLGPNSIERVGAAYRLDVDPGAVDVARFGSFLDRGDIEGALAEWNGVPLAGLDASGFDATVDGLIEQWLGAMELDLERQIESDTPAVVGQLTELTASYPFREGLWALLMTALYRVGRQADALAAYRRARQHLVEQLGVEPGPRLRDLEASILQQDEDLNASRSSGRPDPALPSGTVTFGFCDVAGAARLWLESREHMSRAMQRYDELLRTTVSTHSGHIFASDGDSYGIAFHRPSQAVAWAHELTTLVVDEPWPGDLRIGTRVGLHTGEAEERGNDYFGSTVNVASRVAAAGHRQQILLSGATSMLVSGLEVLDLGTYRIDDLVADQRIYQLGTVEHPPLRIEDGRRGNLARRSDRLIGREADLQQLAEVMADSAIVTLVGPGGIGKTRLAMAAARMVEVGLVGGAWLIELGGIAASSDVPRAVAAALDVKEGPAGSLTEAIVGALVRRDDLLVLDNCEHVLDGVADFVEAVAAGCPDIRVLATSREGLAAGGEQLMAVAPLEPESSGVELFNERAVAVSRSFELAAHREQVEEICRRLDGVPLAIELAAARTRTLAVSDIVARLDDRLRLLTGGRRTGVERHRTLRATIQWSFDLLSPPERDLFRQLSIFAGPFDVDAAHLVASDGDLDLIAVDDLLGGLVDRSMLIVESGPFGRRFRMLETMRQFGADQLAELGRIDRSAERHARWCLAQVTDIHEMLAGTGEVEGVARLAELWPNLRAAFDWACALGDADLAQQLLSPIATEVSTRNMAEIGDWAERLLAIVDPDDEDTIVLALMWAAFRYMLSQDQGSFERLVERYGEPDHALVRCARHLVYDDDHALLASGPDGGAELRRMGLDYAAELHQLATEYGPMLACGQFEEHDRIVTELVERYKRSGPPTLLHWTYFMLGFSAAFQGDQDRADVLFQRSAEVDVPDKTMSVAKPIEARIALRRGNRLRAYELLLGHLDEMFESDNVMLSRLACIEFINMMVVVGRRSDAALMLGYLETTGLMGELSTRTVVAEAAAVIEADPELADGRFEERGRQMQDREAIGYMRDLLTGLTVESLEPSD